MGHKARWDYIGMEAALRHLDLFSGIGGFALAAKWTWGDEYENVGHSEVEPFPCKVYHRHFPESECLGDITKIKWEEGQADLITGGFPCQPHSVAGKRKGSGDERDLWGECVRALAGVRPRYAVFENVPGIITSEFGFTWERIKVDLEACGYEGVPILLSAANVGAKHRRLRVWIVAHAKSGNGHVPAIAGIGKEEIYANGVGTAWVMADTEHRGSQDRRPESIGENGDEGHENIRSKVEKLRNDSGDVADTIDERLQGRDGEELRERAGERAIGKSGTSFFDPAITGLPDWSGGEMGQPWPVTEFERPDGETKLREVERDFRGVAHGVSRRVDRLRGLGNAIVPQVAQVIFEAIKHQPTG